MTFPRELAARTLVLIPALNEEEALPGVLNELREHGLSRVRVIDNGSTDQTAKVAAEGGAEVVSEPKRGYGQACWTGLQHLPPGIEWILFCDADGSDDLGCLPEMGDLASNGHDFILANRRSTSGGRRALTPVQRFGNALSGFLISCLWDRGFADLGPLRLIRISSLESIGMRDRDFGWTVEMQARAAELGIRTTEISAGYRPRQAGSSKISGTIQGSVRAGTIILSTIGALALRSALRSDYRSGLVALLLLLVGASVALPWGNLLMAGHAAGLAVGLLIMSSGFVLAWLRPMAGLWFWLGVFGARFIMLWMAPGDDIFRYIWEGRVQNAGFNPYLFAPSSAELAVLRDDLHAQVNHPSFTAIYPPLAELIFRLLAWLPIPLLTFTLAFTVADLVPCWLLQQRVGSKAALIYAWSPIVIYSFAGGGHYDSLMVLAVVAGCLSWNKSHHLRGCFLIGLAVSIKWVALPFLGWMCWQLLWGRKWKQFMSSMLAGAAGVMIPWGIFALLTGSVEPLRDQFAAYAKSAEFIPRILEMISPALVETNTLALLLVGCATAGLILIVPTVTRFGWWFLVILLAGSPLIHLWYFTWLLPFGALLRHPAALVLSVSSLVYLFLPYRNSLGPVQWRLDNLETALLWGPFVCTLVIVEILRWRRNGHSQVN